MPKQFSRREFLGSLGLGGAALAGYARGVEPEWLEIGRHEVKINATGGVMRQSRSVGRDSVEPKLDFLGKSHGSKSEQIKSGPLSGLESRPTVPPAVTDALPGGMPIRLLHVSDLHASDCVSLSYIEEALQCGLGLKPDLICVTGDFITAKYNNFGGYIAVLASLAAAAPAFACLGNHDGGPWSRLHRGYADSQNVRRLLQASGLELLHNRATTVAVRGRQIEVVGLGDCYAEEADPKRAFHGCAATGVARVVLSHNPDSKVMLEPYPWDLLLCGHTHGGQVWLPLIGAPFAPVEDKRFIAGLYRWRDRWIHITKGIGNVHGVRFNCRPEVSLLTLV